jgi:hypothetical protein
MTRALVAVGAALALFFAIFGVAVYVTREKEHVAVDADLADRLGREVTAARETGDPVDLRDVAAFEWDRVVIVARGTPREEISRALGFEFEGELHYDVESLAILVFARRQTLARFADYRGVIPFERLPLELARDEAVLEVDGRAVRPAA